MQASLPGLDQLPPDQQQLWARIRRFSVGDPTADYRFIDRLARENGWEDDYALQAFQEYKKFMFLICLTPHPLTPSDEVDQVWHLHLLYTQSYWEDWCDDTLGRKVHHGPTRGGSGERTKFTDWYALTLQRYQEVFGLPAPTPWWPSGQARFSQLHFERVNLHRNWVLPKPKWLWN